MRNERLIGEPFETPEDAVRSLVAVQSQDYGGAKWALAQRTRLFGEGGASDAEIEDAFARGAILRTHVLRPTWHFVVPADIRWLLALTAPRVHALMAYHARTNALDARTFGRAQGILARALEGGVHATREELGEALGRARPRIDAKGERLGHILMNAELDALVCSGPRRGKQFTYALLDERAPAQAAHGERDRDGSLAELTRRYFTSRGPAQARDFAWWAGLSMVDVKRGLAMTKGELASVVVEGETYWQSVTDIDANAGPPKLDKTVHLLPNYDEYVVAYKDRSAFLPPAIGAAGFARALMLANHLVVLGGMVIGAWRRTLAKGELDVEVTLFAAPDASTKRRLHEAVESLARFHAVSARLSVIVESCKKTRPRRAHSDKSRK